MSSISYNGVDLKIVRVNRFEQKPVYTDDGADYLYTHYIISARCVFNEALFGGGTKTNIEEWSRKLLTPRGILTFMIGDKVVLQGSGSGDAKNGPHPIACDIVEVHGTKTLHVDFVIETWIVNCPNANNALISHRWSDRHIIDERFMTTRIVEGVAIFRSDFLSKNNDRPDFHRSELFQPLPKRMRRENIEVRQHSDGLTISYSFRDVEQRINVEPSGAAIKIEIEVRTSFDGTGLGVVLPLAIQGIRVVVHGRRDSSLNNLAGIAAEVARVHGWEDPLTRTTSRRVNIRHIYDPPTVILDVETVYPLGTSALANLFGKGVYIGEIRTVKDIYTMDGEGENPQPPDSGSRGGYLVSLVAQALKSPCGEVPKPPKEVIDPTKKP